MFLVHALCYHPPKKMKVDGEGQEGDAWEVKGRRVMHGRGGGDWGRPAWAWWGRAAGPAHERGRAGWGLGAQQGVCAQRAAALGARHTSLWVQYAVGPRAVGLGSADVAMAVRAAVQGLKRERREAAGAAAAAKKQKQGAADGEGGE